MHQHEQKISNSDSVPVSEVIKLLKFTTFEPIFLKKLDEIKHLISDDEIIKLQVDFYNRLKQELTKLLQSPRLSKESKDSVLARIHECNAKLASLGENIENYSNNTSQPDTNNDHNENYSNATKQPDANNNHNENYLRENRRVTNLLELKNAGIATELTGASEVYDRSQYNQLQLKYPNLPSTHVVVVECNLANIRLESFSCMDLPSMNYHFGRYSISGYYTDIKWYSVPINQLKYE